MKIRTTNLAAATLLMCLQATNAAESPTVPSKQTRKDMSAAFEKAAVCLRSDRAYAECDLLMAMTRIEKGSKGCAMMHKQDEPAGTKADEAAAHEH